MSSYLAPELSPGAGLKWAAAVASGFLWGLSGVLVTLALGMPPFELASSALVAAVACSALNEGVRAVWQIVQNAAGRRLARAPRALLTRAGGLACLAGVAGGPVASTSCYVAFVYTDVTYAYAVSALAPVIGALLGIVFLRDRLGWRAWVGIALSIGGAVLVTYRPPASMAEHFYLGVGFALLAAVGWAVEAILAAGSVRTLSVDVANTLRMVSSFLLLVIVVVPSLRAYPVLTVALSSRSMLLVVLAGVLASSGYLLFFWALRGLGPGRAMPVNLSYVLWAALLSVWLADARPTWGLLVGAAVIIAGCALVIGDKRRRRPDVSAAAPA